MTRTVAVLAAAMLAGVACPIAAAAQSVVTVDLPAGDAGGQVLAIGSLARISIVVSDRRVWERAVPALRGRMSVRDALHRIADAANARIVELGGYSFRIVTRAPRSAQTPTPPRGRIPPPRETADEAGAEIVVPASKRDVSQRYFAGHVSWVSGDDLDRGGAGGTDRIVNRLTSVASTHLEAGRNKLFIRGIADSSFTGQTQPTVGQYFGDLRLNYNGPDPDLRLIDLRGPRCWKDRRARRTAQVRWAA